MSHDNSPSGDILPACDLCHSRKVKCDRSFNCANCIDAGAECQRLRRGRSAKKRRLSSVLIPEENLVYLDTPQSQVQRNERDRQARPMNPKATNSMTQSRETNPDEASSRHMLGDPGSECTGTSTASSMADAGGTNYHAIQAKDIIQLELNDGRYISHDRQCILKSALEIVSEIAEAAYRQPGRAVDHQTHPDDLTIPVPDVPPRELLFMLLPSASESARIQWPDHISNKTYEKIAAALLGGDLDTEGELFHQYCVCIYIKAIYYLYQGARVTENLTIKSQLLQSRAVYIAAALKSIKRFNVLSPPSVTAIQSLLSGALLMQHLGRTNQCWILVSYASRQIVSLNYHKICKIQGQSDLEQDIYSLLYWCFYLDRTLSALLCRPPSLPDLQVSPTDLLIMHPSYPYDNMIRVLLDLAQVQSKLQTISCCGKYGSNELTLETCQILEGQMRRILPNLQSGRDSLPRVLQYDWVSADFCYYAIFVEIHRTRLKASFSPFIHKECLLFARKSLKAFQFLQQHTGEMPGFDDPYPSFLTWTLFSYPLSPFFVVFCNVIGTLDQADFTLMRQITGALSQFGKDPQIQRLLGLLQALEQLCDPLFQGQRVDSTREGVPRPSRIASGEATNGSSGNMDDVENLHLSGHMDDNTALGNGTIPQSEMDSSADWLMWQLFNSQVPAGWMNWDATSLSFN